MARLRGVIPWLRARRSGWSSETDRAFHDTLFAAQDHDAFSPAYTGNITIRRFADLAAPYVDGSRLVLDVGCGLGEITCELAARFPGTRFLGTDHSEAGVAGAQGNAKRLGLTNAAFEVHDMEAFEPHDDVDLVAMFDAFHHLLDPRSFIARMARRTNRFLLIEPQGDWKGSWARDLDFDWLARDLENIRARLAQATGEPVPTEPPARAPAATEESATIEEAPAATEESAAIEEAPPAAPTGDHESTEEPVENRYSVEALETLFAGYGLTVRGTVSGLDEYPPDPTLDTSTRREFGEIGYRLYRSLDERLYETGLDMHAKHLVVYAEAGATTQRRGPSVELPAQTRGVDVRGSHDVTYLGYQGPREAGAGSEVRARLHIRNESFRALSSRSGENPDFASYHWLDRAHAPVVADGARSPLPRDVAPGEEIEIALQILVPDGPGDYVLAIDLVQEGKAWFSDAGTATLDIPFRVRP